MSQFKRFLIENIDDVPIEDIVNTLRAADVEMSATQAKKAIYDDDE